MWLESDKLFVFIGERVVKDKFTSRSITALTTLAEKLFLIINKHYYYSEYRQTELYLKA